MRLLPQLTQCPSGWGLGHWGVSGEWDICLHSYRKQTGKPVFDCVFRAIVTDNRRDLHRWLKLVHYINPVVHYLYPLVTNYSVVCYFYPVVDYPVVCYFYRVVHYFYQQASLCVCVSLSPLGLRRLAVSSMPCFRKLWMLSLWWMFKIRSVFRSMFTLKPDMATVHIPFKAITKGLLFMDTLRGYLLDKVM